MNTKRSRKRSWPPELKGPFPMQQLEDQAMEAAAGAGNAEQLYTQCLRELWEAETKRRVSLTVQCFDRQWPKSETDWLELSFLLCRTFNAPGFQLRGGGAPQVWDRLKNRQLFADVMYVVTEKRLKKHAAVWHIARNPKKFLGRYANYPGGTLYRQFLRAKKHFDKLDRTDRLSGLPLTESGMIKQQIEFFSAEAERKRRSQATQKSAF